MFSCIVFGAIKSPCASYKVRHTLLICHHAAMMEINGLIAERGFSVMSLYTRGALATLSHNASKV